MYKKSYLTSPFLRKVWAETLPADQRHYPYNIGYLNNDNQKFEIEFKSPTTVFLGDNGSGKSTLLEAIAGLIGFDQAGGGAGQKPIDHSHSIEESGLLLSKYLRAAWLPKTSKGWFFRAEVFFSVVRYLDDIGSPFANYLSMSHGEGFLKCLTERIALGGVFLLDEPESALSPLSQIALLKFLVDELNTGRSQVIMATHSPILAAMPGAQLFEFTENHVQETSYSEVRSFKLLKQFLNNPNRFIHDENE